MTDERVMATVERLGPWYHSIDLGGGTLTPGKGDPKPKFELLAEHLPADLSGMRVLDIGCNAGGVGIEFAKRGCDVVGVEATVSFYNQAMWLREHLNLPNFQPRRRTVYQIGDLGQFDVVVFLGLIYHLRHPQLATDLVSSIANGPVFLSTPIIESDNAVMEWRVKNDSLEFVPSWNEAHYNWWYPSIEALRQMMTVAGMTDIEVIAQKTTPFKSSSSYVNNESAFQTGQVTLKAMGHAQDALPPLTIQPTQT